MRRAKLTAGFASNLAILALANLVTIPAFITAFGPMGWASFAVGQAAGAVAATLIDFGYTFIGPAAIAGANEAERKGELLRAFALHWVVALPAFAVAAVVASVLTGDAGLGSLGAASGAAAGFSLSWYAAGVGNPFPMLAAETVPRVVGLVAGALLAATGVGWAAVFAPLGMLVGAHLYFLLLLAQFRRVRGESPPNLGVRVSGLSTSVVANIYLAAPIMIMSVASPAAVPAYALAEKLYRQAFVGLSLGIDIVQGWVPRAASTSQMKTRIRAVFRLAMLTGAAIIVVTPLLLIFLAPWFGAGSIDITWAIAACCGLVLALSLIEAILGRAVLPALNRSREGARATLLTAPIGLLAVAGGAATLGAAGAFLGLGLGLISRIIWQAAISRSTTRRVHEN